MKFTEPKDMHDLVIHVMGWNEEGVGKQFEFFKNQGYPYVAQWVHRDRHETENMNGAIREAVSFGAKYWHMANDDVEYRCSETIPSMYDWLKSHDDTGIIHPWVEGESCESGAIPYDFYLQDATGMTIRLDMNGWIPQFDEEFLGTGYSELDLGNEVHYRGFKVFNDRRHPVLHDRTNSRRQDKKVFLMALSRRNRLILAAKWKIVGREKWQGIVRYNSSVPIEKRIPTMYEMFNYTTEDLERMWRSVSPEHDSIFDMNGLVDPNTVWENPVIVGYSSRERFKEKFGYD